MIKLTRRSATEALLATSLSVLPTFRSQGGEANARPNIVLCVVDDLRWDEFGAAGHPYLETPNIDRLAREGVMFSHCFHAVPLCSPNRATILTGQYPSRHGIVGNEARDGLSHRLVTFPQALQRAGYQTAHVGKWHMGNDPTPRPGFDYWVSFPGQGRTIDPELFENGELRKRTGYVTDLLTDRAVAFLKRAVEHERPFFLNLAHKAIHPDLIQRDDGSIDLSYGSRFIPAPRHVGRYANKPYPRRRNYVPPGRIVRGAGWVEQLLGRKTSARALKKYGALLDLGTSEETIHAREEMLLAIDEGLGRVLQVIEAAGKLEETVVIFTSDNGYFYGEHGLSVERRMPYEEAIRAPLLFRLGEAPGRGRVVDALVSSVDLAPTLLELAGVTPSPGMQGRSFAAELRGIASGGRFDVFVEYYGDEVFDWVDDASYKAVRTKHHKLIHWVQHPEFNELYDLRVDPYEQDNVFSHAAYRSVREDLLTSLRDGVLGAFGL